MTQINPFEQVAVLIMWPLNCHKDFIPVMGGLRPHLEQEINSMMFFLLASNNFCFRKTKPTCLINIKEKLLFYKKIKYNLN